MTMGIEELFGVAGLYLVNREVISTIVNAEPDTIKCQKQTNVNVFSRTVGYSELS